jgi:pseudouridine-5'-phosphate glycosidase
MNAVDNNYVQLSEEVRTAIESKRPVVALETTIITHGMPYPTNVETALSVQQIIRDEGAVPATIVLRDGKIKVGLKDDEIQALAMAKNVVKASRRDIPTVLAKGLTGSTTVAATMVAAHLVGIQVFVTGGIGGVHRNGEVTMDVSADLQELAKTDVLVVCAGAKSILDIGLTLEMLETLGVPVLGFGTEDFPAFYTRTSGYPVNYKVNSASEVAAIARAKWGLGMHGGILLANPIPAFASLSSEDVDSAIDLALKEAIRQGVTGKEVTPFLLSEVERLTQGASLKANIKLVEHNAWVGASVAKALAH